MLSRPIVAGEIELAEVKRVVEKFTNGAVGYPIMTVGSP
jgi:hypothetical protein